MTYNYSENGKISDIICDGNSDNCLESKKPGLDHEGWVKSVYVSSGNVNERNIFIYHYCPICWEVK